MIVFFITIIPGLKGAQRGSGSQDRRSPPARFTLETCKQIKHPPPFMHLRRPVIPVGPERTVVLETGGRPFPGNQVGAGIDVKAVRGTPAGRSPGPVQIIPPLMNEDKRIPDIDLMRLYQPYPPPCASVSPVAFRLLCSGSGTVSSPLRLRRYCRGVSPVICLNRRVKDPES